MFIMNYTVLFILLCLIVPSRAAGALCRPLLRTTDSLTDSIKADNKKSSLVIGVNYGSNVIFFGRTSPQKYPYTSSDVLYNAKNGFFAYGSVWHILSTAPYINEFDGGVGYRYTLFRKLAGAMSYTHFFIDRNTKIIKSASSNDFNFRSSYDFNLIKSSLAIDYLFGKTNDIFLTLTLSKYFETQWNIFDTKDYLSFSPTLNYIMGTQNFIDRYDKDHDHVQDDSSPNGMNDNSRASINMEFIPLNYSLRLPLAYNRPHYTVEAAYKLSVPVNVEGSLKNRRESFFYLRFFYLFYKR